MKIEQNNRDKAIFDSLFILYMIMAPRITIKSLATTKLLVFLITSIKKTGATSE